MLQKCMLNNSTFLMEFSIHTSLLLKVLILFDITFRIFSTSSDKMLYKTYCSCMCTKLYIKTFLLLIITVQLIILKMAPQRTASCLPKAKYSLSVGEQGLKNYEYCISYDLFVATL